MNQLTIEQLKSLEVGDWVWLKSDYYNSEGYYRRIEPAFSTDEEVLARFEGIDEIALIRFEDYGTKWVAYKNKEQAEGKCVELPCKMHDKAWFVVCRGKLSRIVETYVTKIQVVYGRIEICFNETVRVLRFHSNGKREILYDIYLDKTEAERRLAELTKE